jgi:putative endonuclease
MAKELEKRIEAHNNGTGAKYTRGRIPVVIVYNELLEDKSAACKREVEIKKMSRKRKLQLIAGNNSTLYVV